MFDKRVIVKNGQKRSDKNVIKNLKCFKLAPKAKNKMINGHKFHSGKSSVVKTYLKRGRKKLKSAPEIDLFDWFSNEIEKDDKEARNGLPSSTRSETAVNQVEKEVEDEFVMENHRQVKNAKTSTADNDPSGQKISEEKTKLAYDDQSGFDDSDSGFPDEHARFSFTEEVATIAPYKRFQKTGPKNCPQAPNGDLPKNVKISESAVPLICQTNNNVTKPSQTDFKMCTNKGPSKGGRKMTKTDPQICSKLAQSEPSKSVENEGDPNCQKLDSVMPSGEGGISNGETESPTRLRERKRKKFFAEIDDFDTDLKKAIRLSKLYAAAEEKKEKKRLSTLPLTDTSTKVTKKKRGRKNLFKDLNVCWSGEDFESTEIVFLNPADNSDGSKNDSKVRSETSVCHYCNFHAISLFAMRQHLTNNHLNKTESDVDIRPEFKWMVVEKCQRVCCAVCEIQIENFSHLLQHFRESHEEVNKSNINIFHLKFKRERLSSDGSETSMGHNCLFCDFGAKSTFLLQKHMRQVHNIRINPQTSTPLPSNRGPYSKKPKCSICNKWFSRIQDLKRHKLFTHQEGKQFKCDHCSKRFWSIQNMALHVSRIHVDQSENQTITTDPETETYKDLIIQTNPEVKCPTCGQEFIQESLLLYHISTEHSVNVAVAEPELDCNQDHLAEEVESIVDEPEEDQKYLLDTGSGFRQEVDDDDESYIISDDELDQLDPGERKFKCNQCDKSYMRKHHLIRHHKQAHEIPDFALYNPDQPVRGKSLFRCSICCRRYIWKQDLKRHQKKSHRAEGEVIEEFVQDHIPILPNHQHDIQEPEEILTDDFRFQCSECNRSYRWKHHLKNHLMQDHPSEFMLYAAGDSLLQDEIQYNQDESYDQMFEFDDNRLMDVASFR